MRKIKYLTSILFIIFILLFTGDMYVWNADSFEVEYNYTTFYLPENGSQNKMLSDIEKAAQKHDCLIFAVSRDLKSVKSETVNIYCMEGAKEIIQKETSVKEGDYFSFFLGDVSVRFKNFKNIPDVERIDNCYYILGSMDNAVEFKRELVDEYTGAFPRQGYAYCHSAENIGAVWVLGVFLFLLLTLYETVLLKKEIAVRFIYGESLFKIIIKRILTDIAVYGGGSAIAALILKLIFNVQTDYKIEVSLLCLGVFCIADACIYLRLMFIDYKSSLSRSRGNKTVLNISYCYKTATIIIITLVMSVCTEMMAEGLNYWGQKKFFEEHNNYSYATITPVYDLPEGVTSGYLDIDCTQEPDYILMNKYNQAGKAFLNATLSNGEVSGRECIIYNKSAVPYLKGQIKEIADYNFTEKLYFIIPEKDRDIMLEDIKNEASVYVDVTDYEVITYNNCRALGVTKIDGVTSRLYKNPLIILYLGDFAKVSCGYISQSVMFNISEEEFEQFISGFNVDKNVTYLSNVNDTYNFYLTNYQRILLLGVVAFIFLAFMELIIIKTTLNYECTVNSVELALKTVYGYGIFEKYRKMFLTTLISLIISGVACMAVSAVLDLTSPAYLVLGYLFILVLDMAVTLFYIRTVERASIQKILKGGAL